eukprot:CAMPEP_0115020406 /NCGR_PEP_ID=MMETSP0216-20121206/30100_1 /TAXON_ID=223996 /ORGANISM="Protocruzia adherens, Strain Boccale" /LENGTH=456 /DNA_ID=CAMNT_0002392221 /DNA_START=47 /DNA_END=1417 /DNA_ORIENTATION=-
MEAVHAKFFNLALVLLFVTSSHCYKYESLGSKTIYIHKRAGENKPNHFSFRRPWGLCNPVTDGASCVSKIPESDLFTQENLKLECLSNRVAKNVYDLSQDDDVWKLISAGEDTFRDESVYDKICGFDVHPHDNVVVLLSTQENDTQEINDESQSNFVSRMRTEFHRNPEKRPNVTVEGTGVDLDIVFSIPYPPQGSSTSFRPYLMVKQDAKAVDKWQTSDGPRFCQPLSDFSSTDPNYGKSFTISMKLSYDEYLNLGVNVKTSSDHKETSSFTLRLETFECNENNPYLVIDQIYIAEATVIFNSQVTEVAEFSTTPLIAEGSNDLVITLEATLKWCDDGPTCSDTNTLDSQSFVVNNSTHAMLEVEGTTRLFDATGVSLVDEETGESISGGIAIAVVDDSQPAKIIFEVTFLKVHADATLSVTALAKPASRLLEDGSDDSKTPESAASRKVSITAA